MSNEDQQLPACECCGGESGGETVGVACIPGAPFSICWCRNCLQQQAVPSWLLDHDFIFAAEDDPAALNEYAADRVTWADGKYMPFSEYVKRLTPDVVKARMLEVATMMGEHF